MIMWTSYQINVLCSLVVLSWCAWETTGFSLEGSRTILASGFGTQGACRFAYHPTSTKLSMGLYDDPLPPPSPPQDDKSKKNKGNNDEDEDTEPATITQRLFSFSKDGNEVQNLLLPLGRSLEYGIDCYYEEADRKVQNLAQKSSCHPMDAAWALEACKGDTTEAWTRISVAQRQALEAQTSTSSKNSEDSAFLQQVKAELADLILSEEFEEIKEQRLEEEQKRKRDTRFRPEGTDSKWLPINNPKPIDDEPWFTG